MNERLEWRVVVAGVGDIGSVTADAEDDARCAACYYYAREGDRPTHCPLTEKPFIYGDDEFEVRPVL
jgi:hypothetical protein